MGLYPGSLNAPAATTYGPLPDHGRDKVALVLHTTETAGMPGFNHGDTAPHYVYKASTREWFMMAEYESGYVGTMKGHSTGGHGNCKAFQVEIIGYSNPEYSPWVGDFTNENYEDLAEFYGWAVDRYGIGFDVTPTPEGGWRYGVDSPYRLSEGEWADFGGICCHGSVPLNSHWDTGVLDLQYIHDLALGGTVFTHYEVGREYEEWESIVWLLYILEGGVVDPNENSTQVSTKLPWKGTIQHVHAQDLELVAKHTNMTEFTLAKLLEDGLYRYGKEIAALNQYAYVEQE